MTYKYVPIYIGLQVECALYIFFGILLLISGKWLNVAIANIYLLMLKENNHELVTQSNCREFK